MQQVAGGAINDRHQWGKEVASSLTSLWVCMNSEPLAAKGRMLSGRSKTLELEIAEKLEIWLPGLELWPWY